MKAFVGRVAAILDQMRTWGVRLPQATPAVQGPTIRVLLDDILIGTLWQEATEFCFRYDASYAKSPGAIAISAFPDLEETYRSPSLWPFFAVRIPPSKRSDVRDALKQHGLKPEQTLEILGTLAKSSMSNPYHLDMQPG
jgi:HipA-like protein